LPLNILIKYILRWIYMFTWQQFQSPFEEPHVHNVYVSICYDVWHPCHITYSKSVQLLYVLMKCVH
jgi:hypothetical protein